MDCRRHFEKFYFIHPGRNISHIRMLVSDFLTEAGSADWLLYVTPHDPHRCGHTQPRSVTSCQREYYRDNETGWEDSARSTETEAQGWASSRTGPLSTTRQTR